MKRKLWVGVVASLAAGLIAVGTAGAGNANAVENGGFETGTFKPWKAYPGPGGIWEVYGGCICIPAPPPVEGDFAVIAFQPFGPSAETLTQKIRLRGQNKPSILSFWMFYANDFFGGPTPSPQPKSDWRANLPKRCAPDAKISCGPDFCAPDSLVVDGSFCNQQIRIDLLKANADPKSTAKKDVLKVLFVTLPGAEPFIDWTPFTFDLGKWNGQTVQLRFAIAVNEAPILFGLDDVRVGEGIT